MANEINIQATLTSQRYSPPLQGFGSLNLNQTGTRSTSYVVNVATGASSNLQIDGTNTMAYIFAKNLDTAAWSQSNYISVALETGITNVVAKLRAGEFCMIPIKEVATLYARATGTAADLFFMAAPRLGP